ncbi:MAG: putative polysaccharide biosynthesis protein [Bacillota bacterium]|jgi:stage V sporulation protein B
MSDRHLIKGTLVLTTANLVNRLLGLVNQVLVLRLIGSEGYGLFQLAIPIYMLALVFTTAGIPVAVSKLVAEELAGKNSRSAHQILRWSVIRLGITGMGLAIVLALLLPSIGSKIMADPRAIWCVLVLIPTLPITAVSSAFRGYFQGIQRMAIPAVAQVIEQAVRVVVGLYLAKQMTPWGVSWAATGYTAGVFVGETAGCLLLISFYIGGLSFFKRNKYLPPKNHIKSSQTNFASTNLSTTNNETSVFRERIWPIAGPVTLTRIAAVLLLNAEAILIPSRIENLGYSQSEATALYGLFTGVVLTLVSIPNIFTTAISTNLLPAVSAAQVRKDHAWLKKRLTQSIYYTIIISFPLLVILWVVPEKVSSLIFGVTGAGVPLRVLATGGLFLYVIQITNGVLNGLGRVNLVLGNSLIMAIVRIGAIYIFTSRILVNYYFYGSSFAAILESGVGAVALAYILSYVVGVALNLTPLNQIITLDIKQDLIIPLVAGFGMGVILHQIVYRIQLPILEEIPLLILASLIGLTAYLAILIWGDSLKISEARAILFK